MSGAQREFVARLLGVCEKLSSVNEKELAASGRLELPKIHLRSSEVTQTAWSPGRLYEIVGDDPQCT